jgi:pilus assembly protein Flp/PilA
MNMSAPFGLSSEATRRIAPLSVQAFVADESGQDLIEYALLALVVSLVAVSALAGPATKVLGMLTTVTAAIKG